MRILSLAQSRGDSKTKELKKPKPKVDNIEVKVDNIEVKVDNPAPEVNVDLSGLPSGIADALKPLIDAVNKPQPSSPVAGSPTEWEFTFHRDSNNLVKSITAKAK